MISYSPAQWTEMKRALAHLVPDAGLPDSPPFSSTDDRCVNEGGERDDGTICRDKAEASGWCKRCAAELFPAGWATGGTT